MKRIFILLLWGFFFVSLKAKEPSYEYLYTAENIDVSKSIGEDIPTYMAQGVVEADFFELMAVIADIDRRKEWVSHLAEVKKIEGDVENKIILYEKMAFPWPFSDRDVVVESTIRKNYQTREIWVDYHNVTHKEAPPTKGIERVPLVQGGFYFKLVGSKKTFCKLHIKLQIGGHIPRWAMDFIVKKIPEKTLSSLLTQVKKTSGEYKEFIHKHSSV